MTLSDEDRRRIDEEETSKLERDGLEADTCISIGKRLEPSDIEVGANFYQGWKVKAKRLEQLSYGFVRAARPDVQSFVLMVFPYVLVLIASLSILSALAAKDQIHENDAAYELLLSNQPAKDAELYRALGASIRLLGGQTEQDKANQIPLEKLVKSSVIFCVAFILAAVILRGRWRRRPAAKGGYTTGVNAFLIALIAIAILWTPVVILSWYTVSLLETFSLAQKIDKAFADFFVILPGIIAWTAYPLRR
jgi:hypothetical protein